MHSKGHSTDRPYTLARLCNKLLYFLRHNTHNNSIYYRNIPAYH